MSDYGIDKALYEQAVDEMVADYMHKHPIRSERLRSTIEHDVRAHSKNILNTLWHSAVRMNEEKKASNAKQPAVELKPFDESRYAGMSAEFITRRRKSHEELNAKFQKTEDERRKLFGDSHRNLLIATFYGMPNALTGIEKSTAEKIVDEWILPKLAA